MRITFSPRRILRESENENLVRGTMILDATGLSTREVRYQCVRRNTPVGEGKVMYAPVTVDGSVITLPTRISGSLKLSGSVGLRSMAASWMINQSCVGFERVSEQVVP